jgi:hypothetical protein
MPLEPQLRNGGGVCFQIGRPEGRRVRGLLTLQHRPFEPGQIRKPGQACGGREAGEEIGELGTVFGQARLARRMTADELGRGVGEEPLVGDAAGRREVGLQGLRQQQPRVVAIDLQALGRGEPVMPDIPLDAALVPFEQGGAEPALQLGQGSHAASRFAVRSRRVCASSA